MDPGSDRSNGDLLAGWFCRGFYGAAAETVGVAIVANIVDNANADVYAHVYAVPPLCICARRWSRVGVGSHRNGCGGFPIALVAGVV